MSTDAVLCLWNADLQLRRTVNPHPTQLPVHHVSSASTSSSSLLHQTRKPPALFAAGSGRVHGLAKRSVGPSDKVVSVWEARATWSGASWCAQVQLPESNEISCLASDGEQLYAVGTSAAAHVIDPRARRPAVDRCTSLQNYQVGVTRWTALHSARPPVTACLK